MHNEEFSETHENLADLYISNTFEVLCSQLIREFKLNCLCFFGVKLNLLFIRTYTKIIVSFLSVYFLFYAFLCIEISWDTDFCKK